jgi:hypothetical protein
MTRSQLHASLALGSVLAIAIVAAVVVPPLESLSAEARAERICRGTGIGPMAADHEYCLTRVRGALARGGPETAPETAYAAARATSDARETCRSRGLQPRTDDYAACLDRETQAHLRRRDRHG